MQAIFIHDRGGRVCEVSRPVKSCEIRCVPVTVESEWFMFRIPECAVPLHVHSYLITWCTRTKRTSVRGFTPGGGLCDCYGTPHLLNSRLDLDRLGSSDF